MFNRIASIVAIIVAIATLTAIAFANTGDARLISNQEMRWEKKGIIATCTISNQRTMLCTDDKGKELEFIWLEPNK